MPSPLPTTSPTEYDTVGVDVTLDVQARTPPTDYDRFTLKSVRVMLVLKSIFLVFRHGKQSILYPNDGNRLECLYTFPYFSDYRNTIRLCTLFVPLSFIPLGDQ
jgi:hypothetical protein